MIAFEQGLPEAAGYGRIAPAQHPGHDVPAGALDGQPEPDRGPFAPNEGRLSSNTSVSQSRCWAFPGHKRSKGRANCCAFFTSLATFMRAKLVTRTRCCVAHCVQPRAFLLARSGPPARLPRAQTGLGTRSGCSGSGHARHCANCGEFAHCRILSQVC